MQNHNRYMLYYYSLCPFSRKVIFFCDEIKEKIILKESLFWKEKEILLKMNLSGNIPILHDMKSNCYIYGATVICNYIADKSSKYSLLGLSAYGKAHNTQISNMFDYNFYIKVSHCILYERIYKSLAQSGTVNLSLIRKSRKQMVQYLDIAEKILRDSKWFSGNKYGFADITVASHISSLDYVDEMNWKNYKNIRAWYSVIKSKPSFSRILELFIPEFLPPPHYHDLDF